ncbi:hypothetical protein D3C84_1284420 [compost metagenome]
MVAGGDETDAVFAGAVKRLLGGFTCQVEVDTGGDCLVDVALAAAGAPADPPDHLASLDQQWLAT